MAENNNYKEFDQDELNKMFAKDPEKYRKLYLKLKKENEKLKEQFLNRLEERKAE